MVAVLTLNIPFAYNYDCPMAKVESSKKMACCTAKVSKPAPGQNISAKCCCEFSKSERTLLPGVYVVVQNEVSQKVEKNLSIETGEFSLKPYKGYFTRSKFEFLFQKKPKPETKIYTLISSYLI